MVRGQGVWVLITGSVDSMEVLAEEADFVPL